MALKFRCAFCDEIIIVKYLSVGEEARCYNCGNHTIVPENSIETSEEASLYKQNIPRGFKEKRKKPAEDIRKFLASKRMLIVVMLSSVLGTQLESFFQEPGFPSSMMAFVISFCITYSIYIIFDKIISFKSEFQRFKHIPSPKDTYCDLCNNSIPRGQLAHIRGDWLDKILFDKKTLCDKCYDEVKQTLRAKVEKPKGLLGRLFTQQHKI